MNDWQMLTISVAGDDTAARILSALANSRKLPRFSSAIENGDEPWMCYCALEEDMLAFERKNRWCGAVDGWRFVVGTSDRAASVPLWLGYGIAEAWLEYEPSGSVVVVKAADEREDADVVVREADELDFAPLATAAFADDSAIHLNRAVKEVRALEGAWEL